MLGTKHRQEHSINFYHFLTHNNEIQNHEVWDVEWSQVSISTRDTFKYSFTTIKVHHQHLLCGIFLQVEILLPEVRLIKTQKVVETRKTQEGKNSISEVLETCTKSERAHQSYVSSRTSRERRLWCVKLSDSHTRELQLGSFYKLSPRLDWAFCWCRCL